MSIANRARQLAYEKIKIDRNCEMCSNDKNLIRHHFDYKKPLEIIILCKKCHKWWHREMKAKNNDDDNFPTFTITIPLKLHKQLKIWCAETNKTINGTIIELIENHLNKINKKISSQNNREQNGEKR